MALTSNMDVDHYIDQELRSYAVAASTHVYKGALVGLSTTGYAKGLQAGDLFIGIAYEEANNAGGSNGDLTVRVYTLGDFGMTLTGATVADIGRPVFASADDTLSFAGGGHSYVGVVQDVISTNEIILRSDPARSLIKTIAHAVSNLSAGGDVAERAIHAFGQDGWVVAARVVNQAGAAAGINDSNTCTVVIKNGTGSVASETFNTTTTFPAANSAHEMTGLQNQRAAAGDVLTLAVTNGTTADPGPFLVQIDYL